MADLSIRGQECLDSFTQIIDEFYRSTSNSFWSGTTEATWASQRTRLRLWIADLHSLEAEIEAQIDGRPPNLAEILAVVEDLEHDLQEVLLVVGGARLPLEQQELPVTEDDEQLPTGDEEDFHELAERLESIVDAIDCLFRATNSQFDHILLLQSAKLTRISQSGHSDVQSTEKGKGTAVPEARMSPSDASNMPGQTVLATRPMRPGTHRKRVSSAVSDDSQGAVRPTRIREAVAAEARPGSIAAPSTDDRSSRLGYQEARELHQPRTTVLSSPNLEREGPYAANAASSSRIWRLDTARGLYYTIDLISGEYVYQDGSRTPFSEDPRAQLGASSDFDPQSSRREVTSSTVATSVDGQTAERSSRREVTLSTVATSVDDQTFENETSGQFFRKRPREYFQRYRVFAMRPDRAVPDPVPEEHLETLQRGGTTIPGICIYVIIVEANPTTDHVVALPILTYGGQGVGAKGVVKHEHGIICSSRIPSRLDTEIPGRNEQGMVPIHVRISIDDNRQSWHQTSRINYGKPTKVPLTAEVLNIGSIAPESQGQLVRQYKLVHDRRKQEGHLQ